MGFVEQERAAARLARNQAGLINRAQLMAIGFTEPAIRYRRRVGRLAPVVGGVFAWAGAPSSPLQRLWAGVLHLGDGSAVSHASAADCWGLASIRPSIPEFSTVLRRSNGKARTTNEAEMVVHRVDEHFLQEIAYIDDLPVSSVRRTLLDLAGRRHRRIGQALDAALRKRLTELGDLWLYLEQEWMRGRRGVRILRNELAARTSGLAPNDSDLEVRLRRMMDAEGFPPPEHQFPVLLNGYTIHIDLAYPELLLAIEVDGWIAHSDMHSFDRDRERDAELSLLGWHVLRFTWAQIQYRSAWVLNTIRHHLDEHASHRVLKS